MNNISMRGSESDNEKNILTQRLISMGDAASVSQAIQVKNVFYTYDKHFMKKRYVLNDLNINAPKGQIYALLGPSGCGKTTLLKCVTGIFLPNRGNIVLSGIWKIPGSDVGYMPQELSLLTILTTRETFSLFGKLYGIPNEILAEKTARLSKLFELAPDYRLIENLSGGQKRRVSLVCALLHDPLLLVLDEPTVGLDPLLREMVWNYMMDLTQTKQTTILLTTHYIEEAKDAHVVGLMREGKLLVEECPSHLLKIFNEKSLEKCFYRVCESSQMNPDEKVDFEVFNKDKNEQCTARTNSKDANSREKSSPIYDLRFSFSNIIPSLIRKNTLFFKRHCIILWYQIALPIFCTLFCGMCVGTNLYDIPLGIFNEESPPFLSLELLRQISVNPVQQRFFDDKDAMIDFVKSGKGIMSLHIPASFSECWRNRMELGIYSSEADVKCASVYLYVDNTNRIASLFLHYMIIGSFEIFQKDYIRNYTGAPPLVASIPISFEYPVYGNKGASYAEYILPAFLICITYFMAAAFAAIGLITEKQSGMMERLSVCGVNNIEVFFAQLFTSVFVVCVQVLLMFATQFTFFETKLVGSYILVSTLILLQGFCGMLFAFFASSYLNTVKNALLIGIVVYFPTLIMCGILWPLEGMPHPMQWLARFMPVTQTAEALRSVMSKGFGLENFQVQMGLLSVIAWSGFFLMAAMLIFRAQK